MHPREPTTQPSSKAQETISARRRARILGTLCARPPSPFQVNNRHGYDVWAVPLRQQPARGFAHTRMPERVSRMKRNREFSDAGTH